MSAVAQIAVIGTGRMGAAMVGRLVTAGFDVTVFNRTRAKAETVARRFGASMRATARDAAASAQVVLVSLADDAAVRDAYGGPDGLVAGLQEGSVVADTSTVAPATVRSLEPAVTARGAALLDTPVSGSVASVEQGSLTVMVGGEPASLDRIRPVLEPLASRVVHLGRLGNGATMKLAVNSALHALNIALCEALVLAERAGIEPAAAYDVFASSAVGAPFVRYKRAAFLTPQDAPVAFSLDLAAKDLELAAALAGAVNAVLPQLVTNRQVVAQAVGAGLGEADLTAVAQFLRDASAQPATPGGVAPNG